MGQLMGIHVKDQNPCESVSSVVEKMCERDRLGDEVGDGTEAIAFIVHEE